MFGTFVNEKRKWKRWHFWKNWASKAEQLISLKFITYWEINFVQFRSFIRQPEHALGYCQIYTALSKWEAVGELCQSMIGTWTATWKDARSHSKVVEGDEMWMLMYSPEIKQQGQCKGPVNSVSKRGVLGTRHVHLHLNMKNLLIFVCFFVTFIGWCKMNIFPGGQIINQRYYFDTLWLLEESGCWKLPEHQNWVIGFSTMGIYLHILLWAWICG